MGIICSNCKVVLKNANEDGSELVCPNCSRFYYPGSELVEYDDDVYFSHDDDMPEISGVGGGAGIMSATDAQDPSLTDQLYKDFKKKPNDGFGAESWD